MIYVSIALTGCCFCTCIHIHSFNSMEKGHFSFSILMLILIVSGIFLSAYSPTEFVEARKTKILSISFIIIFIFIMLVRSEAAHKDLIEKLLKHLSDQQFLRLVLDTHSSGIVVLND